jgi:hypothetical protein
LLSESSSTVPKVRVGVQESFVELVQEKVENPLEFSGALKTALQNRSVNSPKAMVSHLYVKHFLFVSVECYHCIIMYPYIFFEFTCCLTPDIIILACNDSCN